MAEGYTTRTVAVRRLEPKEDAEIALFEAPFDGLIANVTFTPSKDIRGAYYTRQLDMSVFRNGSRHHAVGSIQLGTDEVLLPGGEKHNARLHMPPVSLRVHEGDSMVWSSIGSVGEGLAVPEGVVEVVFERKDTPYSDTYSPDLWRQYVPDYWIGKDMLLRYHDQDIHEAKRTARGPFSSQYHEYVGTFQGADSEMLQVAVHPIEHGRLPRDTGFPYGHVDNLKLMEDKQGEMFGE